MKKLITRAVATVAAVAGIAAGTLVAAPQAQAAAPGDLAMIGGVSCEFKRWGPNWNSGPIWQMTRWMGVKNVGGAPITNVRVTEVAGNTYSPNITANGQRARSLRAGQTFIAVKTTWAGCWPSSISGYVIGDQVENLTNNFGFWMNVRQIDPPRNAPAPETDTDPGGA